MRGRVLAVVVGLTVVVAGPSRADGPAWADWSGSPRPMDPAKLDPLERAALAACGPGDLGLRDTARAVLDRKLRGLPLPELDAIEAAQRTAGEPHPWPRVWAVTGRTLEQDATMNRLASWLGGGRMPESLRRCGVAGGSAADGTHALVVVAVDAVADLAPLPTRARTGQWLTVEARLRQRAHGGRVLVMAAGEAPHTVPSWFDGSTLHARFPADRPGATTVQVVANLADGPRPVLEAVVFTDVEPPPPGQLDVRTAPGEDAAPAARDDDRLTAMITAARATAGLPPLVRDARLDAVARDHAARMVAARELAHDAGDGDPLERMTSAGLDPREAGENLAHAPTVPLAHRALWASPSHRANLLGREYDRVGVAVVRDAHGDVWAVETFTGGLR